MLSRIFDNAKSVNPLVIEPKHNSRKTDLALNT
jgi:hypothetical protein